MADDEEECDRTVRIAFFPLDPKVSGEQLEASVADWFAGDGAFGARWFKFDFERIEPPTAQQPARVIGVLHFPDIGDDDEALYYCCRDLNADYTVLPYLPDED
ncbi:hypothetical protein [Lacticaseibacillus hegangensis]|uniref:Uncharacterized protein n=1 Tax=Lacticaseibacillus hegangensis TaxID=2486010 RepID=A0ABW4D1I3_9LACO|nr:hypothetical protein [Lacticaseibacillus hegangensis]